MPLNTHFLLISKDTKGLVSPPVCDEKQAGSGVAGACVRECRGRAGRGHIGSIQPFPENSLGLSCAGAEG